jgi:putative transposase of IS4/5 family DUF4096/DDE family transposase
VGLPRTDLSTATSTGWTRAPLDGAAGGPQRVLWVLRTGAPWHDLPRRYPPYQTCHRRFQLWQRSGRLELLLQRLAEDLRDRGKIDLSEAFVDATFAGAKKGGAAVGPTRRGKGSKIMAICDRHGLPVAVHVASASPYEPHLVPATLDARFLADLPTRLIGDRGYDSDALDERLMTQYGIEMIADSSSEITREVYLHSIPADARAAVKKVEDLLNRPKLTQVPIAWGNGSPLIQ